MKSVTIIAGLLGLFASSALLSEVRGVAGAEITYAVGGQYYVSGVLDDDGAAQASSGELNLNVADHLVIRTDTSKTSFTPLTVVGGASQESVDAAKRLLGIQVPSAYLEVITLHQFFGGSTPDRKNNCEFLVLDQLLNDKQRQSLRQVLDEAQVEVAVRNGFLSFGCQKGDS